MAGGKYFGLYSNKIGHAHFRTAPWAFIKLRHDVIVTQSPLEAYDVITGLVEPVLLDGVEVKGWRIYPLEFKKDFIQRYEVCENSNTMVVAKRILNKNAFQ